MQWIDLAALIALTVAWAWLARGRRTPVPALLALVLAVAAVSMLHWQALPAAVFSLAALSAAMLCARRRRHEPRPAGARRTAHWAAAAALPLLAAAPYGLFPLFSLPKPDGPDAVGTTRIELIDRSRRGVLEDSAAENRRVALQLWYPAEAGRRRPVARYLPAARIRTEGASIARNMGYEPFQLLHLAAIPTHARTAAEPRREGRFPLLLFNHGYRMYPAQNTPLFEQLASHGYVVASIGHPYDSARMDFADGASKPTTPFRVSPALKQTLDALVARMDLRSWRRGFPAYAQAVRGDRLSRSERAWVDDTAFVLQTLEAGHASPLAARLAGNIDFTRLAYGGMSFGGGVAAKACEAEPRCRAVFSLDGVTYDPRMYDRDVRVPLLLLHTDWTAHPLFRGQSADPDAHPMDFAYRRWAPGPQARNDFRMRVRTSAHMAMTDLVHLTRWPGRDALYGTIDPDEMDGILRDFTLAFLERFVRGQSSGFPKAQLAQHPLVVPHDPQAVQAPPAD